MNKPKPSKPKLLRLAGMVLILLPLTSTLGQVSKKWVTEPVFRAPESIVFDSSNKSLYVSNFNDKGGFRNSEDTLHDEYISKLDVHGNILEFKWIDGLFGPTGLAIHNNRLFIVERDGLSIASIEEGRIEEKIFIDNAGFLNDVAVDRNGRAYVSDSRNSCIYRIQNGTSEPWISDTLVKSPNGLFVDSGKLLIGNAGDANLISVSFSDMRTRIIASGVADNIDGIRKLNDSYLLSWRTELFILDADNEQTTWYRSETDRDFLADFEFVEKDSLIFIPTLLTNRVIALKID